MLLAKQPLYQLSYTPDAVHLVGLTRIELVTSRLSGVHSNHLSYRPIRAYIVFNTLKNKQYKSNFLSP